MLNRVVNGFTIIAHEFYGSDYVILGVRRNGPGTYEYVTARMVNVDHDTEWAWGNYISSLAGATENYYARQGL